MGFAFHLKVLVSGGREWFALLFKFALLYHFFMPAVVAQGKACGAQGAQTRPPADECSDLDLEQLGALVPSAPVSVMLGSCTFPLT